jgi:hypothetical protein
MRTPRLILLAVAALAGVLLVAGCGSNGPNLTSKEGAPVELGDLSYNVVISRPLNPNDVEDAQYLKGAPTLPDSQFYFGVFLQVENNGDTTQTLPQSLTVVDTEGNRFNSVSLDNDFALKLPSRIDAGASLPLAESSAANGPIGGSMVLFLIDQTAAENRPLELEIPSTTGETGTIELDL